MNQYILLHLILKTLELCLRLPARERRLTFTLLSKRTSLLYSELGSVVITKFISAKPLLCFLCRQPVVKISG